MADNSQPTPGATGQTATAQAVTGNDGVVMDKNKPQEQYIKEAQAKYIVPALVREKFPDLIKLIYETESMNEEEREYWLQIMPIMSEEQIVKFRDILVNEKDQLAKLDKEYDQEMQRIKKAPTPELDETQRKEQLTQIKTDEKANEETEKGEEESLLQKLNNP
ncbi:MAG: hypothetical protein AAB953_03460 [Patescibacteria group bacterium]